MMKWVDTPIRIPLAKRFDEEEVLAFIGLAVFYAQSLEGNLVWLASLVNLQEPIILSEESLGAASDEMQRRTMGQLVHAIRKRVPVPVPLEEELRTALDARNGLIHGFIARYKQNYETKHGRQKIIAELRGTAELLMRTNQTIAKTVIVLSEVMQSAVES